MIRNEAEYKEAVGRVAEERLRLERQQKSLEAMELSAEQVKLATDPIRSFHLQLVEEVGAYERLKRGEFDELCNLDGLGQLLISLRIAQGLSQRQLAQRLGINESQVSRDERNEYRGVTLERAIRILDALGVELRTRVETREEVVLQEARKP